MPACGHRWKAPTGGTSRASGAHRLRRGASPTGLAPGLHRWPRRRVFARGVPPEIWGNALIAHELAHVSQRDGGAARRRSRRWRRTPTGPPSEPCVALDGTGEQSTGSATAGAGLRLQRCAGPVTQVRRRDRARGGGQTCATLTTDQWRRRSRRRKLGGDKRAAAMTKLAEQALCELGSRYGPPALRTPTRIHPDDYAGSVLNFDAGLNSKSAGGRPAGTPGRGERRL
jgi:hypothetical protein